MDSNKTPMAGGLGIAVGAIGGSLVGAHYGQMSLGLVLGLAAGALLAAIVWYVDSRKG
jgi:predicted MFS family arabinose efflux permease